MYHLCSHTSETVDINTKLKTVKQYFSFLHAVPVWASIWAHRNYFSLNDCSGWSHVPWINIIPIGVYLPILKLHSILPVAWIYLPIITQAKICYCGQISLQSAAVILQFFWQSHSQYLLNILWHRSRLIMS